jgi:hypothetical protein
VAGNEKRLIIPSELIAEIEILYLKHYVHSYDKTVHDIFNAIHRRIWKCATVDAVEVVHGEWEKQQGIYSCSICGKACPYDVQADVIVYWPCNYCPNCGAKMDGERRTE